MFLLLLVFVCAFLVAFKKPTPLKSSIRDTKSIGYNLLGFLRDTKTTVCFLCPLFFRETIFDFNKQKILSVLCLGHCFFRVPYLFGIQYKILTSKARDTKSCFPLKSSIVSRKEKGHKAQQRVCPLSFRDTRFSGYSIFGIVSLNRRF